MSRAKLAVVVVLALAVGAFFALDLGQYLRLEYFKGQQAAIEAYTRENPLQSAATYFVVYVAVTALSFPGAAILTLVGGAIFGLGFPPFLGGPFRYVDKLGASVVLDRIRHYRDRFGLRFDPAPVLVEMAKSGKRFHD